MTDEEFKTMTERGAKAWTGVTDADITALRDGGIAELELENKLLRARNDRLEAELLKPTDAQILYEWDGMPLLKEKRAMMVLFARKVLVVQGVKND